MGEKDARVMTEPFFEYLASEVGVTGSEVHEVVDALDYAPDLCVSGESVIRVLTSWYGHTEEEAERVVGRLPHHGQTEI